MIKGYPFRRWVADGLYSFRAAHQFVGGCGQAANTAVRSFRVNGISTWYLLLLGERPSAIQNTVDSGDGGSAIWHVVEQCLFGDLFFNSSQG